MKTTAIILLVLAGLMFGSFSCKEDKPKDDASSKDVKITFWDFEAEHTGNLPSGFSQEKGQWRILEDINAPSGKKVLAQTSGSKHGSYFNLVVVSETNYADLELEVKFKAVNGSEDQGGGPVFRYQDKNNYYIVRVNPLEDNFRVYKVVNGNRQELAGAEVKTTAGKYRSIKILARGPHIQCWYDGQSYLNIEDTTFQGGAIGLWTKADAITYFDDLKVSPLEEDKPNKPVEPDNTK